MRENSQIGSAVSALLASLSTGIFFPLEKAKAHMIVGDGTTNNSIPRYKNSLEYISTIYKKGGILEVYRG